MKERGAPHQVLPKVTHVTTHLRRARRTANSHLRKRMLQACKTVATKKLTVRCDAL